MSEEGDGGWVMVGRTVWPTTVSDNVDAPKSSLRPMAMTRTVRVRRLD